MSRKPLHSALLVALTGVALVTSHGSYAQAVTPELQFYPANGWDLKKDNVGCVLSSAFNNGFTMSLSGAESWVDALQVNFQQDIFEQGKTYAAKLDVPGVAQARYEGIAVNASTLSLNFKESRKLYKAMRSAAIVDMNVESNDFRFYLTGFSNAAGDFERCMAGGGVKAKPDPEIVEAMAETPADAKPLVSRLADLKDKPADQDFTGNEAMALEAKAVREIDASKPMASVEISPENPQPSVQSIPYTEKTKLKETVVEEKIVSEGEEVILYNQAEPVKVEAEKVMAEAKPMVADQKVEVERAPEAIAAPEPMVVEAPAPAPEVVEVVVEKPEMAVAVAEPVAVTAPQPAAAPRSKMSSRLAEEIRNNPDLIANGGGFVDLRKAPGSAVSLLKEEPAPIQAETIKVADVMLPDEEGSAPQSLQDTMEEEPQEPAPALPELNVRDVEPLEAVRPNDKPEKKPLVPMSDKPVQVASSYQDSTPSMKVTSENIRANADFTSLEPAAADPSPYEGHELTGRIAALERQLGELKAENEALNNDLQLSLRESEDERMSVSSENWNLERATMRYNEAERQIKRLGVQLAGERAKCNAEQKDLEAMLFDPQVTNDQQLARLTDLERQLMDAKAELNNQRMIYEERIRALEAAAAQ